MEGGTNSNSSAHLNNDDKMQLREQSEVQVQERLKEEFKKETIKKEETAEKERKNLEPNILQLKGQMQTISEESGAAQLSCESEKGELLSSYKDIEEMRRSYEVSQKAWEAEKGRLLSALCKSEEKAAHILKKSEADLSRSNRKYEKLFIAYDSLTVKLIKSNDTVASLKDERQSQEALSAKRLEAVLMENRTLKQKTSELQHMVCEGRKQYSELNHQYQGFEKHVKQEIERLQTDTDHTRSLLEIQIGRCKELNVKNVGLDYEIQELRKSLGEMQRTHARVVEEKGLLIKQFESLHTEFRRKWSEMHEKELKMVNEIEKHRKEIESLAKDKAFLESEKVSVVRRLEEVTQRYVEIHKALFHSNWRVRELEDQVSHLDAFLEAGISEYNSTIAELDNANEQLGELLAENAQLEDANQKLSKSLEEASKRMEEIQYSGRLRMLCLEDQVSELFTEMATTTTAHDEVTAKLRKIEEETKKQANELCEMSKEKEGENKKRRKMSLVRSAWVASAGALAAATFAAYVMFSK